MHHDVPCDPDLLESLSKLHLATCLFSFHRPNLNILGKLLVLPSRYVKVDINN